ncbi:CheR family methyltransferase [Paenibacillus aquistagni]|uniref:CheR family methyltransferase n=1 Tax=Paenibacillus aquistagni TaxID=1852522 RepID=UPI000B50A92E|nr:protein-glutamate O-methyltransferase CheR [Paenibacillus aquistagni]
MFEEGFGFNQTLDRGQDHEYREQVEIELLLEGMFRVYGFDFRDYAFPSLRRRIWHQVYKEQLGSISALQGRLLYDREAAERLVETLSIPVTEMFRDPAVFKAIREKVLPAIRELPAIRIWHAGCSTGEEVYSMAILLEEEGLLDRSRLYATDMNLASLKQAREGLSSLEKMKQYTTNYLQAGGKRSFSEYYKVTQEGKVEFDPRLRRYMLFSDHHLATDKSFNEFHVILCRNVMIYFNDVLRDRVHQLIYDSLAQDGILVLGSKESIHYTAVRSRYEEVDAQERIYRKVR